MTAGIRRHAALISVIGAMLVGTALRCAHLGDVPPALNQDEVVNGYDALDDAGSMGVKPA